MRVTHKLISQLGSKPDNGATKITQIENCFDISGKS